MDDNRLTLIAEDMDDLPPLSALLQDAVVGAGDIAFERKARRLVLLVSRYRWEAGELSRIRTGVRIESVIGVERRRWPHDPAAVLDLLALTMDGDALTLSFAGGIALRARVECVNVIMEDMSSPWPVKHRPGHD